MPWYFKHDSAAKDDQKVLRLELRFGKHLGYALWFKLLEVMVASDGVLNIDNLDLAALSMRIELKELNAFLKYCYEIDLLEFDGKQYVSRRMQNECERICERSAKNQANAKARWEKPEPPKKAKRDKKLRIGETPSPVEISPQVSKLIELVESIKADIPTKQKCELQPCDFQSIIDRLGYDEAFVRIRVFYSWKFTLGTKPKHTDIGTIMANGGWVQKRAAEFVETKIDDPVKRVF